jgi:branched-chain amino acid transport system ATP-binding protein
MSYLEATDVSVRYSRGAAAVHEASLSVDRGECAVVLGANGAGKTSLVRSICGFLPHEGVETRGEVTVDGVSVSRRSPTKRARTGISYIPERDKIFRELNISENLEIFAQRRRTRTGLSEDKALALDMFPALSRLPADRPAGLLSGGEQQMLAITGAILSAPDVLLVDEPSLGLAPIIVLDMMTALGHIMAERNLALLLVDQNVRSTQHLAQRVYTMDSGHLQLETGPNVHERLIREGYSKAAAS